MFFGARLIQQTFFACLICFSFFMNLLLKIYMKRYDRYNETLWTTHFFSSVIRLVSCSSENQVSHFILSRDCDRLKFDTSAAQEKKKLKKQNKTKKTNKQTKKKRIYVSSSNSLRYRILLT